MTRQVALVLVAIAVSLIQASAAETAPRVVASIKPVHAIASAVMAGMGTPELLLPGGSSPHSYALKPSDARKLAAADAVFWIGPDLETVLLAPLRTLARDARIVALASAPNVVRLQARRGGTWESDEHAHDAGGASDGHVWLDPRNGAAMASAIAETLAAIDPANGARYRQNEAAFRQRMTAIDAELAGKLAGLKNRPYIVFHDAYQYFEARYGLSPVGAVAVAADRPVGPRRVSELRDRLKNAGVVCAFATPEFPPRLFTALTNGTAVRTQSLDDLGADIPPGPLLYETLLTRMGDAVAQCLRP